MGGGAYGLPSYPLHPRLAGTQNGRRMRLGGRNFFFYGVVAEAIPDARDHKTDDFEGLGPDSHISRAEAAETGDYDSRPPVPGTVHISKSTWDRGLGLLGSFEDFSAPEKAGRGKSLGDGEVPSDINHLINIKITVMGF